MSGIAVLFPGQGSQSIGMLKDLYDEYASVQAALNAASTAIDLDLAALMFEGPAESLNSTENTQPALLAASFAIWQLTKDKLPVPQLMAGHSLGEYSALVAAGAISLENGVRIVRKRGQLMQSAVPAGQGAMAAILNLDDAIIEEVCRSISPEGLVGCANYNSPGQVVIAGKKELVEQAMAVCKERGAKRALALPVSGPFHSAMMRPAADQFAEFLRDIEIQMPHIPVLQNAQNRFAISIDDIKSLLVEQIASPVMWTQAVGIMATQGITQAYEVGPGQVLSGLVKRINPDLPCTAVNNMATLEGITQ